MADTTIAAGALDFKTEETQMNEETQTIEMVCRLIGMHSGYPLEFKMAAVAVILMGAVVLKDAILEYLG